MLVFSENGPNTTIRQVPQSYEGARDKNTTHGAHAAKQTLCKVVGGKRAKTLETIFRNMDPGSYAGVPSITIPARKTKSGLPVGILLEGPVNADEKILRVARVVTKILEC